MSFRAAILISVILHAIVLTWGTRRFEAADRVHHEARRLFLNARVTAGSDASLAVRDERTAPDIRQRSPEVFTRSGEADASSLREIRKPHDSFPGALAPKATIDQTFSPADLLPEAAASRSDPRPAAGGVRVPDNNLETRAALPPEVEARSPDPEDVRSYRMRIAVHAASFKEYPPIARERGWEGVVGVRLRIQPDRPQAEVTLASSSGVPVLDAAALRMIVRASRAVEVPNALRGRPVDVELPVDYRLD